MSQAKSKGEQGFTLVEVAVASLVMTIALIFLATLFTLAITQNRVNNHFASTTVLAQQKLEELLAIERTDGRLKKGGGLEEDKKQDNYWDQIYVDDNTGTIQTIIPAGQVATYARYWLIQDDPGGLPATFLITVQVVALQASRRTSEFTVLTTTRSF